MSRRAIIIPVATLAAIAGISQGTPSRSAIDGAHGQPLRLDVEESFGKLPLAFEINRGQFDPSVRFVARGADYVLFLTATEAVLDLRRVGRASDARSEGDGSGAVLRMRLANANPAP